MMEWDATKLEKFDGHEWKRFIHEPFTAEPTYVGGPGMFNHFFLHLF